MWDKFLAQGNYSGQGGIRTRDLSIPKPAFYHKALKMSNFNHGKGLWKHNNSLLGDFEYLNTVHNKIIEIKQQYMVHVYTFNNVSEITDKDIQFTIDDQLFLDTFLWR